MADTPPSVARAAATGASQNSGGSNPAPSAAKKKKNRNRKPKAEQVQGPPPKEGSSKPKHDRQRGQRVEPHPRTPSDRREHDSHNRNSLQSLLRKVSLRDGSAPVQQEALNSLRAFLAQDNNRAACQSNADKLLKTLDSIIVSSKHPTVRLAAAKALGILAKQLGTCINTLL
jgi:hypothetical protein